MEWQVVLVVPPEMYRPVTVAMCDARLNRLSASFPDAHLVSKREQVGQGCVLSLGHAPEENAGIALQAGSEVAQGDGFRESDEGEVLKQILLPRFRCFDEIVAVVDALAPSDGSRQRYVGLSEHLGDVGRNLVRDGRHSVVEEGTP